jgi:hypothetical protein
MQRNGQKRKGDNKTMMVKLSSKLPGELVAKSQILLSSFSHCMYDDQPTLSLIVGIKAANAYFDEMLSKLRTPANDAFASLVRSKPSDTMFNVFGAEISRSTPGKYEYSDAVAEQQAKLEGMKKRERENGTAKLAASCKDAYQFKTSIPDIFDPAILPFAVVTR